MKHALPLLLLVAACQATDPTAQIHVEGDGEVWATDAFVECVDRTCTVDLSGADSVRVRATPSAGADFYTWQGRCDARSPYCDIEAGDEVRASFGPTRCLFESASAVTGIVLYGQSLTIGTRGAPALTVAPPFPGEAMLLDQTGTKLCDASEGSACGPWSNVESPRTAIVSTWRRRRGHGRFVLTAAGVGGASIADLSKGGAHYQALLDRVRATRDLTPDYVVRAVAFVHGPADEGRTGYAAALADLARDLDADLRSITGQSTPVLLFIDQTSAWTRAGNVHTPNVALAQLESCIDQPLIHCVGPQYDLLHADDRLHLVAAAYRELGERFGDAMYETIEACEDTSAPFIKTAVAEPNGIALHYHAPTTLTLDTRVCPRHPSFGFELANEDSEKRTIRRVTVEDDDIIRIETAADACNETITLGYAASGEPSGGGGCNNPGPAAPYGNVRGGSAALTQTLPVLCPH